MHKVNSRHDIFIGYIFRPKVSQSETTLPLDQLYHLLYFIKKQYYVISMKN